MKPAIETPTGVSSDPSQKAVCCLPWEHRLREYQLMGAYLVRRKQHE